MRSTKRRRYDPLWIMEKHSNVDASRELFCRLDRSFVHTVDRDDALRLHRNRWYRWDIQRCLGQQGGNLRLGPLERHRFVRFGVEHLFRG